MYIDFLILFGVLSFPVLLSTERKSKFLDQISFIVCTANKIDEST